LIKVSRHGPELNTNINSLNLRFLIIIIISVFFYSCGDEGPSVPNTPGNSLKGVYILYEGSSVNTDYAYYDPSNNNINNDVFKTSNSGQLMGFIPGDMHIKSNSDLFITCRGITTSNGGIYKINASTNKIISSRQLVNNPYGFTINNSGIFIANSGANYITKIDPGLNIIRDSILTGPFPSNVLFGFNKYVVCKSAITSEYSLASVNEVNYNVTKIYFDFPPVSSSYNYYGYFISSYTRKTVFRLNSDDFQKIDSIILPTQFGFIGDIIKKSATSFLVIGGNKEIWEVSITANGVLSASVRIANANGMTISGAAYEETKNEIYIADNNDGLLNGEMHIYDASNGMLKSTYNLGGRNPVRFAFKY